MKHNILLFSGVTVALIGTSALGQTSWESDSRNLRASELIGATAQDSQGTRLGEVRDLLVDPQTGEIRLAILGNSNVSGLSDRWIPVPWQAMNARGDKQFTVDVDQQRIQSAPTLNANDYSALDTPDTLNRVYSFYGLNEGSPSSNASTSPSYQAGSDANTPSQRGAYNPGASSSAYGNNQFNPTPPRYNQGQSQSGPRGEGARSGTYNNAGTWSYQDQGNYAPGRASENQNRNYGQSQGGYGGNQPRYDSDRYNERYGQGSGSMYSSQGYRSGGSGQSDYDANRASSSANYGQSGYATQNQGGYAGNQSRYNSDRYNDRYGQGSTASSYSGQGYRSGGYNEYDSNRYSGQGNSNYGQSGYATQNQGAYADNQSRYDSDRYNDRYGQGSTAGSSSGQGYRSGGYNEYDSNRYSGQGYSSYGPSGYATQNQGAYTGDPSRSDSDRYTDRYTRDSGYRSAYEPGSRRSNRAENFRGFIRDIDPSSRTIRVEGDGRTMRFRVDEFAILMANGEVGADLRDFREGQHVQVGFRNESGERRALSMADLENRYIPQQR